MVAKDKRGAQCEEVKGRDIGTLVSTLEHLQPNSGPPTTTMRCSGSWRDSHLPLGVIREVWTTTPSTFTTSAVQLLSWSYPLQTFRKSSMSIITIQPG